MEVEGTRLRRRSRAHNRVATALRGGDPPLLLGGAAALGWCWGGRARWCRALGWCWGGRARWCRGLGWRWGDDALVPRPWLAAASNRCSFRSEGAGVGWPESSARRVLDAWAVQPSICGGGSAQGRRRRQVGRAALHMRWLLGPTSAPAMGGPRSPSYAVAARPKVGDHRGGINAQGPSSSARATSGALPPTLGGGRVGDNAAPDHGALTGQHVVSMSSGAGKSSVRYESGRARAVALQVTQWRRTPVARAAPEGGARRDHAAGAAETTSWPAERRPGGRGAPCSAGSSPARASSRS